MDRHDESVGPVLITRKRSRDHELDVGARAHFEDPAYYASTYASRTDDVAYYVRVASRAPSVLEYGIGNGRVALPLARKGTRVTGVDHSRPMLADLRARLAEEPSDVRARVDARLGDMRRVRLKKRFPLVLCPFNTALHLYAREDVEAWLSRVREHLTPNGTLVFDVSMPEPKDLARDPDKAYRARPFVHPTAGRVKYEERFDYDRVRQILFVAMTFSPETRSRSSADEFMTPLAHRQFYPRELEALLHYNGFDVVRLHGDFDGGPLTNDSDVMIFHAKPRKKR